MKQTGFRVWMVLLACLHTAMVWGQQLQADICVYGGTSGGVMAAVAASRLGKSVILIEPSNHLGGLTSGGLGATDIGNKYAVTGLSRDFYRRLGLHYGKLEMWTFEPGVAERLFEAYLRGTKVTVLKQHHLQQVRKSGTVIMAIEIAGVPGSGTGKKKVVTAKMFIDASYEGDLMASAGVRYTIGREANSVYNETLNGVQLRAYHQFPDGIDPYVVPGRPESGLVYGVKAGPPAATGSGDKLLQAYNYRLCLTRNKQNLIPFTAPANYDPARYELLKRVIAQRVAANWKHTIKSYLLVREMPNGKTDMNNMGPFSTDFIGENHDFPDADYHTRKRIAKAHEDYIKGYLFFLGNDPSVPDTLRNQVLQWGYAKDEFKDNGGFPHQLYVREARRMIGEQVMTEHHCTGKETVDDAIGMAAYTMDSHNCQRIVVKGPDGKDQVKNEGDVQVGGFPPYPISYRSITPIKTECTNLLVPVCLSASHIAYGSIRMEPVFMVLGQSAALAASQAIDRKVAVQQVDVEAMQVHLRKDPLFDGSIPELLVDNADEAQVQFTGSWQLNKEDMGHYGRSTMFWLPDATTSTAQFQFMAQVRKAAVYEVYLYTPNKLKSGPAWSNHVPVTVSGRQYVKEYIVDFEKGQHEWTLVDTVPFASGEQVTITINAGAGGGPVPADAVLLKPVHK